MVQTDSLRGIGKPGFRNLCAVDILFRQGVKFRDICARKAFRECLKAFFPGPGTVENFKKLAEEGFGFAKEETVNKMGDRFRIQKTGNSPCYDQRVG